MTMTGHAVYRYHHMLRSGRQLLPATFKELQAFLPTVDKCSEACKQLTVPIAVMVAGNDTLIMPHQIQASAQYFDVKPITLPGVAHDVMLVGSGCRPCVPHVLQCQHLEHVLSVFTC